MTLKRENRIVKLILPASRNRKVGVGIRVPVSTLEGFFIGGKYGQRLDKIVSENC